MKRTTILLSVLLLLLAGAYIIWTQTDQTPDNIFHLEDTKGVNAIEMEKVVKGEGVETLTLKQDEAGVWKVNEKYSAVPEKVEKLLATLTQIRVVAPIEEAGQESALQILKKDHTRVTVKDESGTRKEYLVGPTNSQHSANIMMNSGGQKAYLVSKPGFQGYISVFYSTSAIEWRERVLFDLTPDQLKRIKVLYPTTEEEPGFDLSRDASGSAWTLGPEAALANLDRIGPYMDLFTGKVSAESFADEAFPEMRDSLNRRTPDVRFGYETLDGKSGNLLLFTRPENVNNYFGYLEGQHELYTIQRFVMDKFLKQSSFFAPAIQ